MGLLLENSVVRWHGVRSSQAVKARTVGLVVTGAMVFAEWDNDDTAMTP